MDITPRSSVAAVRLGLSTAAALVVFGCGTPEPSRSRHAARQPTADDAIAPGVLALRERPEEALVAFREATERFGEEARAWRGRARVALRTGRADEAREAADRALELDDGAETWELAGWVSAEAGRHGEAAGRFTAALERDASRRHLHFALGRAHERAGDRYEATQAYAASAEAGVLPARSHLALARTRLDWIHAGPRTLGLHPLRYREVEAALDAAEREAEEDEALRSAIVVQRRRIEAHRSRASERLSSLGANLFGNSVDRIFQQQRQRQAELDESSFAPPSTAWTSLRSRAIDSGSGRGTGGLDLRSGSRTRP